MCRYEKLTGLTETMYFWLLFSGRKSDVLKLLHHKPWRPERRQIF